MLSGGVSKRLVTIGACATAGGIQALRNFKDVKEFIELAYPVMSGLRELPSLPPAARPLAHPIGPPTAKPVIPPPIIPRIMFSIRALRRCFADMGAFVYPFRPRAAIFPRPWRKRLKQWPVASGGRSRIRGMPSEV